MKKKGFNIISENIKDAVAIRVTLYLEIKFLKVHLQQNKTIF